MVLSDQVGSMHVERRYPFIFTFQEALPFDKVLKLFLLAEVLVG